MFSNPRLTEDLLRKEVVALFIALHDNISMFKQRTGADNQYVYMILGALMNEYKTKHKQDTEKAWK